MTFTVSPWLVWAGLCLVLFGVWFLCAVGAAWVRQLWGWVWHDRVTPLLEDDDGRCPCCHEPLTECFTESGWPDGSYCWDCELYGYEPASGCNNLDHTGELPLSLPPERSWEQMTSHQLPLEPGAADHFLRPPGYLAAWEVDQRQHYAAMGFDYPSGLMARVREAAQ